MNLDLSFYNWDIIRNFVLKGFYFSVTLTVSVVTEAGCAWNRARLIVTLRANVFMPVTSAAVIGCAAEVPGVTLPDTN